MEKSRLLSINLFQEVEVLIIVLFMSQFSKKHFVGCRNMKVNLTLTNLGNLRLVDNWTDQISAEPDYRAQ